MMSDSDDDERSERESVGVPDDDVPAPAIVNELLAYCSHYLHSSTKESLKRVIITFYHEKEISDAKDILWDLHSDVLGQSIRRRTTDHRVAHAADAEDIIKALIKIDSECETSSVYAAVRMDRIPRHTPEEIDMVSIVQRLGDLERKFGILDGTVAMQADTMGTLLDAATTGYSTAVRRGMHEPTRAPPVAVQRQPPPGGNPVAQVGAAAAPSGTQPQRSRPKPPQIRAAVQQNPAPVQSNATLTQQSIPVISNSDETVQTDGDGFQVPKEQIRRQNRRNNNVVYGKGNSTNLTAGIRCKEIFVFNLDHTTDEDALKTFLSSLDIGVLDLECRSHSEARNKSYRIKIKHTDIDKVMDPDIWPEGVGCRLYFRKRNTGTNGSNDGNNNNAS